jgi:hypothetical protein
MNHATSTEEAKVLIPKGPVPRFADSLVHLALLAITPYILSINFRNTYWSDTGAPNVNTKLEALQFAAKLYEILFCASLASTGLHLLRRALWSSEGVPLGSLVTSYGFSNVSVLLSPAFWGGFVMAMRPRQQPRHFAFMIFLVLSILMAAVAGPSAAIILIPQLDWWPQSYNATYQNEPDIYFLNISTTSLWPPSLNKSHLPDVNCLAPTAVQNPLCPAGGYPSIFGQTRVAYAEFLNISMPADNEFRVQFSRPLIGQYTFISTNSSLDAITATTLSQEVAESLWDVTFGVSLSWENQRITITDLSGHSLLKPVVQVECQTYNMTDLEIESDSVQFPYLGFLTPPFPQVDQDSIYFNFPNIYQGQNWTVSISSIGNVTDIEDHIRNGSLYFTWVDLSKYDLRPSIAAAVFVPSCNSSIPGSFAACSVDARWLPTDMWINPTQSESVFDSYPNPMNFINSLAGKHLESRPIDIGIDWANSLNLNLSESSTLMESLLYLGASACAFNDTVSPTYYIEQNLALALADGLARVGCGSNLSTLGLFGLYGPAGEVYDSGLAPAIAAVSNWTRVDMTFSRYGYGYGMNTITKKIAAAVLLTQAVIALATVVALALSKRISSSWSSVGELLALAINSNPTPRLQNTGAGISRLDTWKEKVMVRVVDGDLQMIFEGDGRLKEYSKPAVGKKYA